MNLLGKAIRRVRNACIPVTDWSTLLRSEAASWKRAREAAASGPKVLIATSTGGHKAVTPVEGLLAAALTLRGAQPHFLLCDRFLPACLQATSVDFPGDEFAERGPARLCDGCHRSGREAYEPLGLPVHSYSEWTPADARQKAAELSATVGLANIPSFRLDGLAVGEHALAGALRFFARGDIEREPYGEAVLRRYFHASLLTAFATRRLFEEIPFEKAVFHHGIYVPQGLVGEAARGKGVPVVNWVVAYRKGCFIFSHGDTYHRTLMDEPAAAWEDVRLDARHERELDSYLRSRWSGSRDWIWFHEKPRFDAAEALRAMGVDFSKPRIGMLTNVVWDAQLHYPANAFPNMREWILTTLDYFDKRRDLQLVIRVHPAEIRGTPRSRQRVEDEIRKAYPQLPPNVFLVPPESPVSTYAAMLECDSVLIYGTKTGVELAALGVPVVVAGEAWIRNKGLTLDARSREDYVRLLDRLPVGKRLDPATLARARKYAFHFFFRRMMPIRSIEPRPDWPPFRVGVRRLDDLLPGRDPGLDVVCDGILKGTAFVYPAEKGGA